MTDTTIGPSPVDPAEAKRFLTEVIASADGISADDLDNAYSEFTDMVIDAAAIDMWRRGEITFGCKDGELTMELARGGSR